MSQEETHIPVLLSEVIGYLNPVPGESYLDLTAGYGGHASEILERSQSSAVLVDRDQDAILHLNQLFRDQAIEIRNQDFLTASQELKGRSRQFDMILADLGISSPHLNKASRGFSFMNEGPLDMRMDQRQSLTADTIVNDYSESSLSDIIRRWGEEPKAPKIAKAIVRARPIKTTSQLAEIVASAAKKRGKIHPATKTFQALRIVINNELGQLEEALPLWIDLLTPGGRIVVISFHSLEDRLVKRAFAEASMIGYETKIKLLNKKAVTSDRNEIAFNPRARSAKLRAAVKIKI